MIYSQQLGFNIRGGREHKCGIFLSKVVAGTQVEKLGLKEADQLLSVNGINFEAIDHASAVEILKKNIEIVMQVRYFPYGYRKTYERVGAICPFNDSTKDNSIYSPRESLTERAGDVCYGPISGEQTGMYGLTRNDKTRSLRPRKPEPLPIGANAIYGGKNEPPPFGTSGIYGETMRTKPEPLPIGANAIYGGKPEPLLIGASGIYGETMRTNPEPLPIGASGIYGDTVRTDPSKMYGDMQLNNSNIYDKQQHSKEYMYGSKREVIYGLNEYPDAKFSTYNGEIIPDLIP